jgi:hypothetical protein
MGKIQRTSNDWKNPTNEELVIGYQDKPHETSDLDE